MWSEEFFSICSAERRLTGRHVDGAKDIVPVGQDCCDR